MSSSRLIKAGISFATGILLLNFVFFPAEATAQELDDPGESDQGQGEQLVVSSHDVVYSIDESRNLLLTQERITLSSQDAEEENASLVFPLHLEHLGLVYELSYDDWLLNGEHWEPEQENSQELVTFEEVGTDAQEHTIEYSLDGSFFENPYGGVSTLLHPASGWGLGTVENSSVLLEGFPADTSISCVPDCEYTPLPEGLYFEQTSSPMTLEVFFPIDSIEENTISVEGELLGATEEDPIIQDDAVEDGEILSAWDQMDNDTKVALGGLLVGGAVALVFSRYLFSRKSRKAKRVQRKKVKKVERMKKKKGSKSKRVSIL